MRKRRLADVRTLTLNVNNAKPFVGDELTELLHGAIAGWEVRNEIIWGYTC